MKRSTQLLRQVSVAWSSLVLGLPMHFSQQISLNSCICCAKELSFKVITVQRQRCTYPWDTHLCIDLSLLFFDHQKVLQLLVVTRQILKVGHFGGASVLFSEQLTKYRVSGPKLEFLYLIDLVLRLYKDERQ